MASIKLKTLTRNSATTNNCDIYIDCSDKINKGTVYLAPIGSCDDCESVEYIETTSNILSTIPGSLVGTKLILANGQEVVVNMSADNVEQTCCNACVTPTPAALPEIYTSPLSPAKLEKYCITRTYANSGAALAAGAGLPLSLATVRASYGATGAIVGQVQGKVIAFKSYDANTLVEKFALSQDPSYGVPAAVGTDVVTAGAC
jgi:hypothetical protein